MKQKLVKEEIKKEEAPAKKGAPQVMKPQPRNKA